MTADAGPGEHRRGKIRSDAGGAPPTTIQCLVNQYRTVGGTGQATGSSVLWLPPGWYSGGSPGWSSLTEAPRFWVLNRANPLQQPLSFVASNSATVPSGLEQVLDNNHILVAAVLAHVHRVPQGPLYSLLQAHGAATALAAVENMNTGMACGMVGFMFSYVLVSVAGPNQDEGLEFLDLPAPLTDFSAGAGGWATGTSLAPFDLVLDSEEGVYFPAPSISPMPPA
jgi:hypothetical protein